MRQLSLGVLFCLFTLNLFSQNYRLAGIQSTGFQSAALNKSFETYSVFRMDADGLLQFCSTHQESFGLDLAFENFEPLNASLKNSRILSDDYRVNERRALGKDRSGALRQVYTFNGVITGHLNDHVALTVAKNFIFGYFEQDGRQFFIEPLWYFEPNAGRDQYLVYERSAVKESAEMECALVEEKTVQADVPDTDPPACRPIELQFAIASDFSMVTKFGSVAAVLDHNIGIMNNVQTNYSYDFDRVIIFKIVTQWVSPSTEDDPASSTDFSTFLLQFRNWAEAGGFGAGITYNLGHLRTNHTFGNTAGATFLNGLCVNSQRYTFMRDFTSIACQLQKTTAHEIGHSFGAGHPSPAQNPPTIMDQGGFCTDLWAPVSVTSINNALATKACLSASNCVANPPGQPASMQQICTGFEECVTFDDLCVGGYSISTNDPYLQITTSGTTICLKSLVDGTRTSRVFISAFNHCGDIDPSSFTITWFVSIDDPKAICDGFQEPTPRADLLALSSGGIRVNATNDVLEVLDGSTDSRIKSIQVFDLSGKLLQEVKTSDAQINIPLAGLPQGLFVVQVNAGTERQVTKFTHW